VGRRRRLTQGVTGLAALGALVLAGPAAGGAAPAAAHAPAELGPGPTPPGDRSVSSPNWAGYAAIGAVFNDVQAGWTQPAVTCGSSKPQYAAFWVGIDGYNASDHAVEQIGTDSDCVKSTAGHSKGHIAPSYYAWWEMYPAAPVFLSTSSYPVAPGDSISAEVSHTGATFTLTITDAGHWTFSTPQTATTPVPPPQSSAEWVAETPGKALADFGSVGFGGATANGQPISAFTNEQINMTTKKKHGTTRASASLLDPGGASFSVSWLST